jgi:hypothetical protein
MIKVEGEVIEISHRAVISMEFEWNFMQIFEEFQIIPKNSKIDRAVIPTIISPSIKIPKFLNPT